MIVLVKLGMLGRTRVTGSLVECEDDQVTVMTAACLQRDAATKDDLTEASLNVRALIP